MPYTSEDSIGRIPLAAKDIKKTSGRNVIASAALPNMHVGPGPNLGSREPLNEPVSSQFASRVSGSSAIKTSRVCSPV